MGNSYKSYDPNEDYKKKMDEAAAAGDYASAAQYEQQRNEKIQNEGLTQYQTTNQYAQYLPTQKPVAPQSTWQGQMEQTLQQILDREPFEYDVNKDALYQQYADQYIRQGKLAMQDAMGQAAALTGGYGNSYAQTVGQQTYQDYLGKLNDRVPELYETALAEYQSEGDALYDRYSILQNAQNQDYSRYQDQLSEYYSNLEGEEAKQSEERDYAYSLAMQMLQSGMMPSDALLSDSGISTEDAMKLYEANAAQSYDSGSDYSYATAEKDGLSTKDWTALFQAYREGAADDDLSDYYSELANFARSYDVSEFENYMAQNVDGYRTADSNKMYGNGLSSASFADVLDAARSSNVERVRTLLDMYAGQMSESQWAQIETILEQRGIFE